MNTLPQGGPGRSVGWWLLAGIILRLLAVNQPLVDAHQFRQTQTALITRGMMQEPGWPLGAVATWRGDLPARLVLELPVYNYAVIGVNHITGNLDVSGKLVTVFLWALSFLVLQRLWRRFLTVRQIFWANLLFVLAPLSVFFGQAFMPEMLVQFLAFSFLVLLLRYREKPGAGRFAAAAAVGLLGMVVKGPEIAHLYLIVALVVFRQEGWRALRKPVYWVALIVTAIALKGWSHVMDSANGAYFPEWSSHAVVGGFIGKPSEHVNPVGYLKIALYVTCFVLTPIGLPFVLAGAWKLWRTRPMNFPAWWVGSVIFFFMFWCGPAARGHSYYNLPALGPCALLFGLGVDWLQERYRPARWFRPAFGALAAGLIALCGVGSLYLFRPDRVMVESTRWIREHTLPDDLILVRANHRADIGEYPALATFPYYGERRFWVASLGLSKEEKQRALATSRYALVTLPPAEISWIEALRRRLKGESVVPTDISPWLGEAGFRPVHSNATFVVWSK
jgi:4-amino-4-deoxy-L-arabinose transferase-like glycosyltransferase